MIEATEIETKAEAVALSVMIQKMSESLPDKKSRVRKTKVKSSRQIAASERQTKRSRKASGDTEAAQASLV